jgi:hypothetical protein
MLATSGVSWSQVGTSGFSTKGFAADAAALAYLNRCSKALAQYVGPMAKVFVEEAVRRISPDAPFPMTKARPLAEELASQVEEAKDRSAFLKALQTTDATDRGKSETLTTFADRSAVIFRLKVLHDEILPAYHALVGSGEKVLIQELLERARPLAAKARSGLGPNLIIQSELTEALRKLTSGATLFGDLERLAKATLVPGLVDILCVPWERKETPVQRTWGCSLSEYLEPQSAWITNSLLRGVPRGTELKLPNGVPVRLCAPEEVDRLRRELAQVPRPSGPEVLQREYDTLVTMADTITSSRDLDLALWSR